MLTRAALAVLLSLALAVSGAAQESGRHWVVAWAASAHGPYPYGNPAAQPDLSVAFPDASVGARDQAFRLVLRPTLWAREVRLRFSNAFGDRPVTFDAVHVGLHLGSSAIADGTNRSATFNGGRRVTVAPGEAIWSDAVALPFVREVDDLEGRKLAVSFRVVGESGPMTWHAKALQTSYVSTPGSGDPSDVGEEGFPVSTTSWFFLDALEVMAPREAYAVVALGDSITDGSLSTLNGDDRWPDVLSRRLHASGRRHVAVVNAGIGGNRVLPASRRSSSPEPVRPAGGPSALERLALDVAALSGVRVVIWLEGINDLGTAGGRSAEEVMEGLRSGVARLRQRIPGVRVIGATLTSALGSAGVTLKGDRERKRLNTFIRSSDVFDGVVDFDAATRDPATGALRAEFLPNTTVGGRGDWIHPNRLGYLAMGQAVNLTLLDVE